MVFTGDADLAALVNNHTTLLLEKKKKVQKITIQNFHRFFPTPPALFADFKSLQGDKSDFLKGVDGLFRTEALHLLMEYGSVENYFENGNEHYLFDKIIAEKDKVLVNKKVAQLKYDCPINVTFEHTNVNHIYLPEKIASKVGWH
jgi:DNA polymerase-1